MFEIGGFVAAAWWFLYTTQFKPRIQFDVGCEVRGLGSGLYLLEVLFMFENKGFVEHRLYDLSLSVHTALVVAGTAAPAPSESPAFCRSVCFQRRRLFLVSTAGTLFAQASVNSSLTNSFCRNLVHSSRSLRDSRTIGARRGRTQPAACLR